MQVADYLISSGRCGSIRHRSIGMCEQDTRIEEVVLRAVQRLGFADLRPQQRVAIKTFMQGKDVFVSLPTGYGKSLIYSVLPYA